MPMAVMTGGTWKVMKMGGRFVVVTDGLVAREVADCGNGFDGAGIDPVLAAEAEANARGIAELPSIIKVLEDYLALSMDINMHSSDFDIREAQCVEAAQAVLTKVRGKGNAAR